MANSGRVWNSPLRILCKFSVLHNKVNCMLYNITTLHALEAPCDPDGYGKGRQDAGTTRSRPTATVNGHGHGQRSTANGHGQRPTVTVNGHGHGLGQRPTATVSASDSVTVGTGIFKRSFVSASAQANSVKSTASRPVTLSQFVGPLVCRKYRVFDYFYEIMRLQSGNGSMCGAAGRCNHAP